MWKKRIGKIFGSALAIGMIAVSAEAAQINVIVDTQSGMFSEPEKVYGQVDNAVKGWFSPTEEELKHMTFSERQALKNGDYTLIPIAESDAIVQIYREEKGSAVNIDGAVAMQGREMSMTKEDLAELSKELGADYILYFRVTNSMPDYNIGLFGGSQKVNVITDFRVWDTKQGKYTLVKRYQTKGSSSSAYVGTGSTSRAIEKGLTKALEQIEQEKQAVLEVVK